MLTRRLFLCGTLMSGVFGTAGHANQPAKIVFLRHALAPGFGDPDNFTLGNCSTQRNLNDQGRAQSREIGQRLAKAGYAFDKVYSSQWCRCLETAHLIDLGQVTPFAGLNSFFQGYANRTETLAQLRDKMTSIPQGAQVLMVTHQVVIQAITGRSVASGQGVIYRPQTQETSALTI